MPTVVVILPSSTYRASDFIAAADSLGVDLVVASEQPPPIEMGDRYVQIDCSHPGRAAGDIAALADRMAIDGVVAADDGGVIVAAETSRKLGLPGNTPGSARATRDKLEMRTRLRSAEVDQPGFAFLPPDADPRPAAAEVGFPLVIKPIDRSASQGVIKVESAPDLTSTVSRVRSIVGDEATLLLEEYLTGEEIAIEGMVTDGELRVLAVFDKPDTPTGPFFPETMLITPSRLSPADQTEAERVAGSAVRALGLESGPVHIELKLADGRARVIEVAARSIGGLCSRSLNFGLMGTSLESLIIRNALGLGWAHLRREQVSSGVLMIPTPRSGRLRGVAGQDEARRVEGVTGMDFTMFPGDEVLAPPDGDRYLGFVYARSGTPESVESALRKAMSKLEVQLEG